MWCLSLLFSVFYLFKLDKKQIVGTNWVKKWDFVIGNALQYFNNFHMYISSDISSAIHFHLGFSANSNKSKSKFWGTNWFKK